MLAPPLPWPPPWPPPLPQAARCFFKRGGKVLLTEILSPRIARLETVLVSRRGQARKARIEKCELDDELLDRELFV